MFGSSVLVLGIWKCCLVMWEAAGGKSGSLVPPLLSSCCVTLEWSLMPWASLTPLLESQGGLRSGVARRRRRDDQGVKCQREIMEPVRCSIINEGRSVLASLNLSSWGLGSWGRGLGVGSGAVLTKSDSHSDFSSSSCPNHLSSLPFILFLGIWQEI